jgi:hypothetical protein
MVNSIEQRSEIKRFLNIMVNWADARNALLDATAFSIAIGAQSAWAAHTLTKTNRSGRH